MFLVYWDSNKEKWLKVETVGKVYMAASGAPDQTKHHARNIADVSLELLSHIGSLEVPSGIEMQIRIGELRISKKGELEKNSI